MVKSGGKLLIRLRSGNVLLRHSTNMNVSVSSILVCYIAKNKCVIVWL